jgi:hypothetical protein
MLMKFGIGPFVLGRKSAGIPPAGWAAFPDRFLISDRRASAAAEGSLGGIVEALAPQVGKAALDKLVEQPGIDPTEALFNLNCS